MALINFEAQNLSNAVPEGWHWCLFRTIDQKVNFFEDKPSIYYNCSYILQEYSSHTKWVNLSKKEV